MIQSLRREKLGLRIALTALVVLPLTVLSHRFGWLDFHASIALCALSMLTSIALFIGSIIGLFRRSDAPARAIHKRTLAVSSIGPALFIAFVISASSKTDVPILHDVTTDTIDVPQFDKAVTARGRDSNSLAVVPEVLELQLASYPDVKTLQTSMDKDTAFQHAMTTAKALGWVIYNQDGNRGIIEAYDKTPLWGFIDDVVIRIRVNDQGSGCLVDLRSVSRVGTGDLGANAERIRRFTRHFTPAG